MDNNKRYPKGHFTAIGIAAGIPLGMPVGLAFGHIAFGPALGVPIGICIGAALEKKLNPNPIEPSEEELKRKKRNAWITVGIGMAVFIALAGLYFSLG